MRAVFVVFVGFIFLSYGNTKNHPEINSFIVEAFVKNNNNNSMFLEKFRNYNFDFEKPKLKGDYIIESGLFNPSELDNWKGDQLSNFELVGINSTYTEEPREVSPRTWIEHGGFSADVPEVPASLRHFYDPTRNENERYLTDTVNSKIMSTFQAQFKNPKTNGLDWALGTKGDFGVLEHMYTWEHGKKYFKAALEEPNPGKRKNFMAKAWRSLGETLHMIADHGCPPHVRNDGHPSIPVPLMSYFGNPDPYEELLDPGSLLAFKNGTAPKTITDLFRKAKTTRDIAHQLAVFTNNNFFSNETISGTDSKSRNVKPVAHPKYVYPSPKISSTNYEDGYYYREIEGQNVLMCTDNWFFSKFNIPKGYPYIDEKCVHSQAKILIPTITEAGVNVMKLFIPEFKITITNLTDDGTISGTITHKTDLEYKDQIFYNGPVEILNSGFKKLTVLNAEKGKFTGKVDTPDTNIFAEIECGGVSVRSEIMKKPQKQKPVQKQAYNFYNIEFTIGIHTTYTEGFKDDDQTFYISDWRGYESPWLGGVFDGFQIGKGNSFSGTIKKDHVEGWIEGQRNDQEIVYLKAHVHETWRSGDYTMSPSARKKTRETWLDIELRNIPVDEISTSEYGIHYQRWGWDCDNQRPDPAFQKSLVKLEHKVKFYPSEKEISISSINFSKSEVRTCQDLIKNFLLHQPDINVRVSYNNNF